MSNRARLLAWLGVLLAGAALRLYQLDGQIIADDEWHALRMVWLHGYETIFTRFGQADHCIPLTLFYEWISRVGKLDEWAMRMPLLLAGLASMLLVPLAYKPWLKLDERVLLGALIALWPILIYYSRTARPYALLFLLAGTALPLAYRWWYEKKRWWGAGYGGCTVLAGWMNPLTLALTLSPFLWFGAAALRTAATDRTPKPLLRLISVSVPVVALLAVLVGPPLVNDWMSLTGKTGAQQADGQTLVVFWQLFSGSRGWPVALLVSLLAAVGLTELVQRDSGFAAFAGFASFCLG